MINITDLSLLKITKVKPWVIYFDYDSKHYMIHGNYEIGEGSWQTFDVARDYIKKQRGSTVVYRSIDKIHFVQMLVLRGFAVFNGKAGEE